MSDPLSEDDDYIFLKRFDFSLKKALERYPNGLPNHLVAQALKIEEDEIDEKYQEVVLKLREIMKVDVG